MDQEHMDNKVIECGGCNSKEFTLCEGCGQRFCSECMKLHQEQGCPGWKDPDYEDAVAEVEARGLTTVIRDLQSQNEETGGNAYETQQALLKVVNERLQKMGQKGYWHPWGGADDTLVEKILEDEDGVGSTVDQLQFRVGDRVSISRTFKNGTTVQVEARVNWVEEQEFYWYFGYTPLKPGTRKWDPNAGMWGCTRVYKPGVGAPPFASTARVIGSCPRVD